MTIQDEKLAPTSPFPLLPHRNGALFPGTVATLAVGRKPSLALVKALSKGDIIGVAMQRDPDTEDPALADLHPVGTWARLREGIVTPQGASIVLEGLSRFELRAVVQNQPYWMAEGVPATESGHESEDLPTLRAAVLEEAKAAAAAVTGNAEPFVVSLNKVDDASELSDRIASFLELTPEQSAQLLTELDVAKRLDLILRLVTETRAVAEMRGRIQSDVRDKMGQGQRELLLREQLRAIQKELGEDAEDSDLGDIEKQLTEAGLPEEAQKVADKELARLRGLSTQSPEHNVVRSYLDWLGQLPWSAEAKSKVEIGAVSAKLDADHYGLADVKRRILEHLAVLQRSGNPRGTILCLAGPPGVGKTSLGQSIADALDRPFARVALGGVRDEAEIRGHRRTYVGALPGRILHAMKKAGVRNPVFLLDEIDKLGVGWGGSPEAALLEVLDPEQNKTFQDHYLELPFDLSQVLFICTANDLSQLSGPLRDRLDIIEISGYTHDEKLEIARRHLVPKALSEHALSGDEIAVSDEAIREIVAGYTREAGVRQLAREIGKLCRSLTLELAEKPEEDGEARELGASDLRKPLGQPKFFDEVAERTSLPGVATGLAWTPVGGDILFIETSRMPGTGRVEVTGQLGDVMKESARAAMTFVRSNAQPLTVPPDFLEKQDVHIHVPAGAVPKDGPSAGVTMFTALTSLLTGRPVRSDTAMTGECTLRGRVLPVGGIKEKVLAAHRAGVTRVVLPRKNERDIDEIPAETREKMEFILADDMREVLEAALEDSATYPTDDLGPLPFGQGQGESQGPPLLV